ncbi:hypothetical protein LTR62_001065 [Meristemomyces frigidus]|uniref:Uncharacterized protein n=1 Tax=Meristemomyces frigidus TaxID=1508187 RepID=A0AAN7T9M3_9PEZI|nr:hypothetical protein LTR62_001065 [Meristemomyces frigidus]
MSSNNREKSDHGGFGAIGSERNSSNSAGGHRQQPSGGVPGVNPMDPFVNVGGLGGKYKPSSSRQGQPQLILPTEGLSGAKNTDSGTTSPFTMVYPPDGSGFLQTIEFRPCPDFGTGSGGGEKSASPTRYRNAHNRNASIESVSSGSSKASVSTQPEHVDYSARSGYQSPRATFAAAQQKAQNTAGGGASHSRTSSGSSSTSTARPSSHTRNTSDASANLAGLSKAVKVVDGRIKVVDGLVHVFGGRVDQQAAVLEDQAGRNEDADFRQAAIDDHFDSIETRLKAQTEDHEEATAVLGQYGNRLSEHAKYIKAMDEDKQKQLDQHEEELAENIIQLQQHNDRIQSLSGIVHQSNMMVHQAQHELELVTHALTNHNIRIHQNTQFLHAVVARIVALEATQPPVTPVVQPQPFANHAYTHPGHHNTQFQYAGPPIVPGQAAPQVPAQQGQPAAAQAAPTAAAAAQQGPNAAVQPGPNAAAQQGPNANQQAQNAASQQAQTAAGPAANTQLVHPAGQPLVYAAHHVAAHAARQVAATPTPGSSKGSRREIVSPNPNDDVFAPGSGGSSTGGSCRATPARFEQKSYQELLHSTFVKAEDALRSIYIKFVELKNADPKQKQLIHLLGEHCDSLQTAKLAMRDSTLRIQLLTGFINRRIVQEILGNNILSGFASIDEDSLSAEYAKAFDDEAKVMLDMQMANDFPLRHGLALNRARLARAIAAQPGFQQWIKDRADELHRSLVMEIYPLMRHNDAEVNAAMKAVHKAVIEALKIGVRMRQEDKTYACLFFKYGIRWDWERMVQRNAEFAGLKCDEQPSKYVVLFSMAPQVDEKDFVGGQIKLTKLHKAEVILCGRKNNLR